MALKKKTGEWTVPQVDGTGRVTIKRDGDNITVVWVCGDVRNFTTEGLGFAIDNIERSHRYSDVGARLRDQDSRGRGYAAWIEPGDPETFRADSTEHSDQAYRVEWPALLDALKSSLA